MREKVCTENKKAPNLFGAIAITSFLKLVGFAFCLVGNGQFLTTFGTACSQNPATISSGHSLTEAMLVNALTVRRLKSPFHRTITLKD